MVDRVLSMDVDFRATSENICAFLRNDLTHKYQRGEQLFVPHNSLKSDCRPRLVPGHIFHPNIANCANKRPRAHVPSNVSVGCDLTRRLDGATVGYVADAAPLSLVYMHGP